MNLSSNKLISVVLPSYNGSHFLRSSIESVIAQTYRNWELILVDDCSTDDTQCIMMEYAQRFPGRIQCIHHKVNRKLPAALNTGFAASKGEYLTWTSDDNYYHPEAIDRMVSVLEEKYHVGMIYCDYYQIDSDENLINRIAVKPPSFLINGNCIGPCFLYRRSVYNEIGAYSNQVRFAEDYDYWLRIASRYLIEPYEFSLYFYRLHSDSLTTITNRKKIKRAVDLALIRNLQKLPWITKEEKIEIVIKKASSSLSNRDFNLFLLCIIVSLLIAPITLIQKIVKRKLF